MIVDVRHSTKGASMKALVVTALTVAAIVAFPLAASGAPAGDGFTEVASGHWGDVPWTMRVYRDIDLRYCITTAVGRTEHDTVRDTGCGKRAVPESGIGWGVSTSPGLDFIDGTVLAAARVVVIKTSDGVTVRTAVIPPPPGLDPRVAFFMARIRCGAVVSAVGLGRSGRVVARSTLSTAHRSC
jgi:hypothetical protein